MTGSSYKQAVSALLEPLGFKASSPREWTREQDGCQDIIGMQVEPSFGTTFNIAFNNLETWALLKKAAPKLVGPSLLSTRLWALTGDLHDKWWKRGDPDALPQISSALTEHALPLFAELRSLEFQASKCGRLHEDKPRHTSSQIWLAMTLYRMGKYVDARRVIGDPSRILNDHWRECLESTRQWIEEKTAGLSSPAA